MYQWKYENLTKGYLPRQFEYHPLQDSLIFGCTNGDIAYLDKQNQVHPLGLFGTNDHDPILGLCWFRKHSDRY